MYRHIDCSRFLYSNNPIKGAYLNMVFSILSSINGIYPKIIDGNMAYIWSTNDNDAIGPLWSEYIVFCHL